ncbi:MAG: UTP--glucose-1-phosphate uridylyltransferase [bacterium]|nr:UTP--glucose-1-phosphate uridylyltransferase [bacterium]MBU1919068.1 UTP--glucose-1-phosphate uridylyltransferase [bacterium]
MTIKQAIVPAAGLGINFLPISKSIPKELLPVIDKTCLELVIEEACSAGVEEFIIVTSSKKTLIENYFSENPYLNDWLKKRNHESLLENLETVAKQAKLTFVYQDDPLGLGHAVQCAASKITDDFFFVLLPDDIFDAEPSVCQQMIELFSTSPRPMMTVMEVPWEDVCRYGIVEATPLSERIGDVKTIVEKPSRKQAPSNLAVMGRYILHRDIFGFIEKTKPGAGGEIQLTDAIRNIIPTHGLNSYVFQGERFDTGNPLGLLQASVALSLKHPVYQKEMTKTIKMLAAGI